MVNEGARILEEGYALRANDIDIIYLNGYGFPVYRGGPMWYADTVGLPMVYERIKEFHLRFGELWEPARTLKRPADRGGGDVREHLTREGPGLRVQGQRAIGDPSDSRAKVASAIRRFPIRCECCKYGRGRMARRAFKAVTSTRVRQ